MEAAAYRRLDELIERGAHPDVLRSELAAHPPDHRSELSRYAWGMLDQRYDSEAEAALWLYAWSLGERGRRPPHL